jgi:hypothetical protein
VAACLARLEYAALSDEELLGLVGDERRLPFEELYRRYARATHHVIRRIVGDSGRCQETVQDAFASVWAVGREIPALPGLGGRVDVYDRPQRRRGWLPASAVRLVSSTRGTRSIQRWRGISELSDGWRRFGCGWRWTSCRCGSPR